MGLDSTVSITTPYGVDGPGIEFLPISVTSGLRRGSAARRFLGVAGSNSSGGMDVCVL
jgi:hypothetical protein